LLRAEAGLPLLRLRVGQSEGRVRVALFDRAAVGASPPLAPPLWLARPGGACLFPDPAAPAADDASRTGLQGGFDARALLDARAAAVRAALAVLPETVAPRTLEELGQVGRLRGLRKIRAACVSARLEFFYLFFKCCSCSASSHLTFLSGSLCFVVRVLVSLARPTGVRLFLCGGAGARRGGGLRQARARGRAREPPRRGSAPEGRGRHRSLVQRPERHRPRGSTRALLPDCMGHGSVRVGSSSGRKQRTLNLFCHLLFVR
jgi:hypothetical protein